MDWAVRVSANSGPKGDFPFFIYHFAFCISKTISYSAPYYGAYGALIEDSPQGHRASLNPKQIQISGSGNNNYIHRKLTSQTSYLTSPSFTLRYHGSVETSDLVQDRWYLDVAVLHVWICTRLPETKTLETEYWRRWTRQKWTRSSTRHGAISQDL